MFNFISGCSSQGVPYETYVFINETNAVNLTEYTNLKKQSTNRTKRSVDNSVNDLLLETNRLSFTAYNRTFNIFLKRGNSLVSENVKLEVRYSYPNKTQHTEYEENHFKQNYLGIDKF